MAIRVYGKRVKTKEVFLDLVECDDGSSVRLIMVDEDGNRMVRGNLLTISGDGLYRHTAIDEEAAKQLGIPIDGSTGMLMEATWQA